MVPCALLSCNSAASTDTNVRLCLLPFRLPAGSLQLWQEVDQPTWCYSHAAKPSAVSKKHETSTILQKNHFNTGILFLYLNFGS